VLIVDDQRGTRAALRAAVAARRDLAVSGDAPRGEASAEVARETRPALAIVNVTVPAESVAAAVMPLLRAHPALRVLVVSLPDEREMAAAALAAGATRCVVRRPGRPDVAAIVRAAVEVAASGPARGDGSALAPEQGAPRGPALSGREQQVLELLARGHTRREIAERLTIGVKSIETYRSRLAQKLGVRTRAELVRYALDCGMLGAPAAPPSSRP
jgi:DNA-binding NarL/FixJ family response regulator